MKVWYVQGIINHEGFNIISDGFLSEKEAKDFIAGIDKTATNFKWYDSFDVDWISINKESLAKYQSIVIEPGVVFNSYQNGVIKVQFAAQEGYWHCQNVSNGETFVFSGGFIKECLLENG